MVANSSWPRRYTEAKADDYDEDLDGYLSEDAEEAPGPDGSMARARIVRASVTVDADIIPRVVQALTTPVAEVRAGRLLQARRDKPSTLNP